MSLYELRSARITTKRRETPIKKSYFFINKAYGAIFAYQSILWLVLIYVIHSMISDVFLKVRKNKKPIQLPCRRAE